ncbi:M23 family metallopeptidase, partial [Mizugakiibacter sediminis]|uniref:M23 family metallopeptidase n=1 Tax=Mizugakiibacter sediminis TaxID=1475481 RepID=UPI001F1E5D9A
MARLRRFPVCGTLAAALILAGCASSPAPVVDRSIGGPRAVAAPVARPAASAGGYVVQSGDTLYSIAFRHGLDYRELARWNGIDAPYTIHPGQALRLTAPAPKDAARVGRVPPSKPPVAASRPAPPPPVGVFEPVPASPQGAPAAPSSAPVRTAPAPAASASGVAAA